MKIKKGLVLSLQHNEIPNKNICKESHKQSTSCKEHIAINKLLWAYANGQLHGQIEHQHILIKMLRLSS